MTLNAGRNILLFVLLCGLCALASYLFLWNLGAFSISLASDEVVYVRVAQSVYHRGELFPLRHGNVPMFEKPPLKFWLAAVPLTLFGESNFTFRVLDGVLGILCGALLVLFAARLFGLGFLAVAAGLLFLAPPEIVISHHGFRRAALDGLLSLFVMGCAWFSWSALERGDQGRGVVLPRLVPGTAAQNVISEKRGSASMYLPTVRPLYVASICAALAVLTKSVAGFVPLLCSAAVLCAVVPWRGWYRFIVPYAVAPLVFVLYVLVLYGIGSGALRTFLGVEIVDRVFGGFTGHNTGDPFYYFRYLFRRGGTAPAALLALGTVGALWEARRDRRYLFLIVWAYVPVLLFSFASSKVPWYLNPYVPFLVMTALFGCNALLQRIPWRVPRWAVAVCVAVLTLPPLYRALGRNIRTVAQQTQRIELDLLVESLRAQGVRRSYIFADALSGRSNPVRGRFNVEGIYRQMLRPVPIPRAKVSGFAPDPGSVVFSREEDLALLPSGWTDVTTLRPFSIRGYPVRVVRYDADAGRDPQVL